jgi:hypothetical protein
VFSSCTNQASHLAVSGHEGSANCITHGICPSNIARAAARDSGVLPVTGVVMAQNLPAPRGRGERGGKCRVPDSALLSVLSSAGVAGVFCVLFICGLVFPRGVVEDLKEENRELKEALEAERDRANASVAAASATRDVLAAIQLGRSIGTKAADGP